MFYVLFYQLILQPALPCFLLSLSDMNIRTSVVSHGHLCFWIFCLFAHGFGFCEFFFFQHMYSSSVQSRPHAVSQSRKISQNNYNFYKKSSTQKKKKNYAEQWEKILAWINTPLIPVCGCNARFWMEKHITGKARNPKTTTYNWETMPRA